MDKVTFYGKVVVVNWFVWDELVWEIERIRIFKTISRASQHVIYFYLQVLSEEVRVLYVFLQAINRNWCTQIDIFGFGYEIILTVKIFNPSIDMWIWARSFFF